MTTWYYIYNFSSLKGHIVSESLLTHILNDLIKRDCSEINIKEISEAFIDLPGMIMIDRPTITYDLFDLKLKVPCEDVFMLSEHLSQTKIRDEKYYKLHVFLRCLVLSPKEKSALYNKMIESVDDCETQSMKFYESKGNLLPRTNGSRFPDGKIVLADQNGLQIIQGKI